MLAVPSRDPEAERRPRMRRAENRRESDLQALPTCALGNAEEAARDRTFPRWSRTFRYRSPPIQTLQRIEPGAGANPTRATSSNGRAARGRRGVTESTAIRTAGGWLVVRDFVTTSEGALEGVAGMTVTMRCASLPLRPRGVHQLQQSDRSRSRLRRRPQAIAVIAIFVFAAHASLPQPSPVAGMTPVVPHFGAHFPVLKFYARAGGRSNSRETPQAADVSERHLGRRTRADHAPRRNTTGGTKPTPPGRLASFALPHPHGEGSARAARRSDWLGRVRDSRLGNRARVDHALWGRAPTLAKGR